MNQCEDITLTFRQGSSHKQYSARLIDKDDGWVVTFAYGRVGKPMKTGTKTPKPISYEAAKGIYDKLVHQKQLKGYTADAEAEAFADNPNAGEDTGFRPQLLNEIQLEDLENVWHTFGGQVGVQIKWDGERRAVFLNKGKDPIYSNRNGLRTTVKPAIDIACRKLIDSRSAMIETLVLDCEDMGNFIVVFDVLQVNKIDMQPKPFVNRQAVISALTAIVGWENLQEWIRVEHASYPNTLDALEDYIAKAETANEEGVVIRDMHAAYEPGKPNSGGSALKYKFTASATVQVIDHTTGKRSVEIGVLCDEYPETPMKTLPIGKVTIPPNYDIPEIGELVEVEYMNIIDGGKLFQPRYKGTRPDKTEADYHSTLKFKKEEE